MTDTPEAGKMTPSEQAAKLLHVDFSDRPQTYPQDIPEAENCPCCGSSSVRLHRENNMNMIWYSIVCRTCQMRSAWVSDIETVLRKWNTRPINRHYRRGQEDMRERAAVAVEAERQRILDTQYQDVTLGSFNDSVNILTRMTAFMLPGAAKAIRDLPLEDAK